MTTPIEVAKLIGDTAPPEHIDERLETVAIRASLDDSDLRTRWASLRDHCPGFLGSVAIVEADSDAELEPDDQPTPGQLFRITLQKIPQADSAEWFLPGAITKSVDALGRFSCIRVALMGTDETFTTFRARVEQWTMDPASAYAASEPLPDPRKCCLDLTQRNTVPDDIRPWLLRATPAIQGTVFHTWAAIATQKLLTCVADQIAVDGEVATCTFLGPPRRTLVPNLGFDTSLFSRLSEAAQWVFSDGRDVDTRHLLLANEWARTLQGDAANIGHGALESAQSAYAAYVKSGSKETLKALADLRKAVVEESQKIVQRAQDMAGAMWKDLAVAVIPFALKFFPDADKALAKNHLAGGIAIAAAAFLTFSFRLQIYINKRYFKSQEDSRVIWKRAINTALSASEIAELSEQPISQSILDYNKVRNAVGTVYCILIGLLIGLALFDFF